MDDKDKRIAQLEAELAAYRDNPASEFYVALVDGVKHLTERIKNKTLVLNDKDDNYDSFADAILKLSEKSEKIFLSLEKGAAAFQQKDVDMDRKSKVSKGSGVVL